MSRLFSIIVDDSGSYASTEEARRVLAENYEWEGPPAAETVDLLNSVSPEGGFVLPPEEDVQRRQALTGTVRQKMLNIVKHEQVVRRYPDDPEVQRYVTKEAIEKIPRQLMAVVNFHCDSKEEFVRRAKVFLEGTPDEKGRLVLETFRPMEERYQQFRGHMPHDMTPDQIAENFELLYDANSLLMELDNITTQFPDVHFKDEEREELRQFPREFDTSITAAYNYGQIMAEDYYAYFPPENFRDRDDLPEISNKVELEHPAKASGAVDYLGMTVSTQNRSDQSEVKKTLDRSSVGGFAPAECRWLKEDFTPYEGDPSDSYSPVYQDILQGKNVHALLPNGEIKTIARRMENDGYHMEQNPAEPAALKPYLDGDLGPMLDQLSQQLEDTRAVFSWDSQEYKNMRSVMKEVRESVQAMGEHPTDEHLEELQEQMQLLSVTAQAYLKHKEGEKLSALAQKRVDAVQNILNFSKERGNMLNYAGRAKWQEATRQELHEEARGKTIEQWLKDQEPVNPQLNEVYKESLAKFDGFDVSNGWDAAYNYNRERTEELTGIIVADEYIRQERETFAGTGYTGPVERNAVKERALLDSMGKDVLEHITGRKEADLTGADVRSALISLDPKKFQKEMERFVYYSNFDPMNRMKEINRQYKDSIQPRGAQPDAYEKALGDFVDKNIRKPAAGIILKDGSQNPAYKNGDSPEAKAIATDLLRDCVLANMVQMERASLGKDGPGNLEKMMTDPEQVKKLQQKISDYPDFKRTVAYDIKTSDVNLFTPNLITRGKPAQLAKDILTKANPEVQKQAANSQPQRQQDAPAKKPVGPKNPQL